MAEEPPPAAPPREPSSPLSLSRSGSSPPASSDVPVTPYSSAHSAARSARSSLLPRSTPGGGVGVSSPLSLLRASSRHSRSTPGSVGRSDLGRPSVRSERSEPRTDESGGVTSGPTTFIWGTNVSVEETQKAFHDFFDEFVDSDRPTDGPFYHAYLERLLESDEFAVNLDCSHIRSYDEQLYNKLLAFPQEVVPIADLAVHELYLRLHPDSDGAELNGKRFTVRCFNLGREDRLRDLDPNDINKLVSIKGMVTRTSSVVPDLYMAFFECSVCATAQEVFIQRGEIAEPQVCTNTACQAKQAMRLVHNRSKFADKQIVRIQEAPEHIPEGETPQTCSMCAWEGLVDTAKPGDRVEITGVFRAVPLRVNPKQRTVRSIYKTYVDIVHVRKLDKSKRLQQEREDVTSTEQFYAEFEEGNELESATAQRVEELKALATRPDLYDQLSRALAPSVWELDDVKKGVLLQLFGGTHKQLDAESTGGSKRRGEINVLLMGDPGTSKSQLLQYVHKVAPRGIYTSGKGSSAVGLTAYVTKDPETREFVLESGALVLSDRGVCCIDEFDKMSDGARSILHETMEQQTVSVAKAGIICSLNARTCILASANPISSKYDPSKSVIENINLTPTLLSRFDLIYLILDKPNERTDRQLATHLLALYQPDARSSVGVVSQRTLMEYISYARKEVQPRLSDAAADQLIAEYVQLRKQGTTMSGGRESRVITATPRQLESLVRLSEAHARMRLSPWVEPLDVEEAIRLMKVATQSAATDPTTGTIDMDLITTGRSAAARTLAAQLAEALREKFGGMGATTMRVDELRAMCLDETGLDVPINELREALSQLEREGSVRMLRQNTVAILG